MPSKVLLSAFNTICSAYWPLDSTLVKYRGPSTGPKINPNKQFQDIFDIFWSIYWFYDQLTIYSIMTSKVLLSAFNTICSDSWLYDSILVKYRVTVWVLKLPPRGDFSIFFTYFDQYTSFMTNELYLMPSKVLLSAFNTICSVSFLFDSILMKYRGHSLSWASVQCARPFKFMVLYFIHKIIYHFYLILLECLLYFTHNL